MKLLALAALAAAALAPALAFPADQPPASADPMAGWKPPQVKHEAQDRKEILAVWKAFDEADRKGDLAAATVLVDFPVLMVTDDKKGQAVAETWNREKWTQVMEPFYKNPDPKRQIVHKPGIFLMSDSLATVDDVVTVTTAGKKHVVRNNTLLVRKDGKWMVKAMTEGGWGDLMASAGAQPAAGAAAPSPAPTPAPTDANPPATAK